jgi:hypothetical protein
MFVSMINCIRCKFPCTKEKICWVNSTARSTARQRFLAVNRKCIRFPANAGLVQECVSLRGRRISL